MPRMKRHFLLLPVLAIGFLTFAAESEKQPAAELDSWLGIYSSPSEIGGFSGTILAIGKNFDKELAYRMTIYSDVVLTDAIEEAEKRGDLIADGDKLYVPSAWGWYRDGKPDLKASLTRYTRLEINGREVLLRDDALKAFRQENKLYDYGILIKVADKVERFAKLEEVKHESIKVLYGDRSQNWKDPFTNGPNKR